MTGTTTPFDGPQSTEEIAPDRPFRAQVVRTKRLSPTFQRVTFTVETMEDFGGHGFDQRINLILPRHAGDTFDDFPTGVSWYETWRALPVATRNRIRTFTVRALRPDRAELDIDFVLHGHGGPASRWAGGAGPGDTVLIVGPDARHGGPVDDVAWCPPRVPRRLLIAGDETAVPAIAAILESLPARAPVDVVLEVPDEADVLDIAGRSGLIWLPRGPGATPGHLLVPAVGDLVARQLPAGPERRPVAVSLDESEDDGEDLWEVPGPDAAAPDSFYIWLAGEAGMVTRLRRHLVRDLKVDRAAVAFMGYWRLGTRPAES